METFAEFLENSPPNHVVELDEIAAFGNYQKIGLGEYLLSPEIQLHCSSEACNGARFFRQISRPVKLIRGAWFNTFVEYRCSNCQSTTKRFALSCKLNDDIEEGEGDENYNGSCLKYGEAPPFGPPTPARLVKLIGPDRDEFLSGRRSENLGLGIGAFSYYRRVVENQKDRILGQIIEVAKKIGASSSNIEELESARSETQFSKALSMVKTSLPESLLIDGHNPLSLLHAALSDGIHDRTDEECLEIASSVRIILGELSERLSNAMKEEAELKSAISTLLSRKKSS